jgi:N-acetylneuraminate lyase
MKERLTGLVAAAHTPMSKDGSLNLSMVPRVVDYLLSVGISGIYICGSTGEGPSLSGEERKALAEAFVEAADERLPIIVQVGHNSLNEARELAAHAQAIGAGMISSNSPSYFKPDDIDILLSSMGEVADGAPGLAFYYYHIPALTGVPLDMVEFLEKGARKIPTLAGIKFSDFEIFQYQSCLNCCEGRFDILWGCDEMLLSALAVGARGAVGSTFNVAAPLYLQIIESFETGDLEEARHCQQLSVEFVRMLDRHAPLHTSLKEVMKLIGLDCGGVRLPQQSLPEGASEKIREDLETLGLMNWIKTP